MEKKRILVGMTGASGSIYGVYLLRKARALGHETHLVISSWGERTLEYETGLRYGQLCSEADYCYGEDEMDAGPASGSFPLDCMAVVPCSMKTLASIAQGLSNNLIARAADCTLKEGRRLVLVTREAPLNMIHMRNMLTVAEAGAIVFPACPSFWHRPTTIDDLVNAFVDRLMVVLGLVDRAEAVWRED